MLTIVKKCRVCKQYEDLLQGYKGQKNEKMYKSLVRLYYRHSTEIACEARIVAEKTFWVEPLGIPITEFINLEGVDKL